ncbi:MAG: serine/threonine-protein kinase [Pseudomonadota bacterium]
MTDKDKKDPSAGEGVAFDETMADSRSPEVREDEKAQPESRPSFFEDDFPKQLGKFYRVTRKIGEGGMGVVFEVEHTKMGKKFAAKVISRHFAREREAVRRFELEAIAASKIDNPHIVQVVHLDTEKDYTYIIMELLKGKNLAAVIDRRSIPIPLAVEISRQVARGLIAAHEAGIIHRDMKPENIFLINQEGNLYIKILDFGISKIQTGNEAGAALTKTGQIIGTPLYFSPEQARGMSDVDGRTDIYALGVIMFEMITGRPVFEAQSPIDLMVKHATVPPPRPRESNPAIPDDLERIILKCLAKDANDRFQSARELLDALNELESAPLDRDLVVSATSITDSLIHVSDSTRMEISVAEKKGGGPKKIYAILGVVLLLAVAAAGVGIVLKNAGKSPDSGQDTQPVKEQPAKAAAPSKAPSEKPVEESAAEKIAFTITSSPEGAEVWMDGELIGETPFIHKAAKDDKDHAFEIRAKGHKTETFSQKLDEDFVRNVKLVKIKKTQKLDIKTVQ